jgi:hypothetical protein
MLNLRTMLSVRASASAILAALLLGCGETPEPAALATEAMETKVPNTSGGGVSEPGASEPNTAGQPEALSEEEIDRRLSTDRQAGLIPARRRAIGPTQPFLVFQHIPVFANIMTTLTSLDCYYASTEAEAMEAIKKHPFCGIFASSPMNENGAAYRVAEAFRRENPDALVVYQSWDYRLEIAAPRGLKCEADLVMIGGSDINETVQFFLKGLERKAAGNLPAPSAESYEAFLREHCPNHRGFEMAKVLREKKFPPSEYE